MGKTRSKSLQRYVSDNNILDNTANTKEWLHLVPPQQSIQESISESENAKEVTVESELHPMVQLK